MFSLLLVVGLTFTPQGFGQRVPDVKATGVLIDVRVGRITVRASTGPDLEVKASVPTVVQRDGSALRIRAVESRKVQEVDIDVQLPRTMPVRATGSVTDVTIAGLTAGIRVDVKEGAVDVRGGTGAAELYVVNGQVSVSDRTGDVTVMAAASGVTLSNLTGTIKVDGTSGSITITGSQTSSVDVLTVSGDIRFSGPVAGNGRYNLASHSGLIGVTVPAGTGASFTLFTASSPIEVTPFVRPVSVEPAKLTKQVYRIGNAAAQVEIRSITGKVQLNLGGK